MTTLTNLASFLPPAGWAVVGPGLLVLLGLALLVGWVLGRRSLAGESCQRATHPAAFEQQPRELSLDITERERALAAQRLRESEERFHAFMDASPIVAFVKDADGRYVYGNRAWAAQFHQPAAALLG